MHCSSASFSGELESAKHNYVYIVRTGLGLASLTAVVLLLGRPCGIWVGAPGVATVLALEPGFDTLIERAPRHFGKQLGMTKSNLASGIKQREE